MKSAVYVRNPFYRDNKERAYNCRNTRTNSLRKNRNLMFKCSRLIKISIVLNLPKGSHKKVIFLMAVPLRGGGGRSKDLAIKKTYFFIFFFIILLPFEYKIYFTLDNLSTYGHLTLKFVGRYIFLLVCYNIFQKIGIF